jgi:hypothetical protein
MITMQWLHHAERDDYDGSDRSMTLDVITSNEMSPMRNRRLRLAGAWLGVVLLVALAIWSRVHSSITTLRISFADDQTAVFEQMRDKAEEGEAEEAADCLSYTLSYYPSGTKQESGSTLDRIVERARRGALRQIIATLRAKTGQDFGTDPKRWVEGLRRPLSR